MIICLGPDSDCGGRPHGIPSEQLLLPVSFWTPFITLYNHIRSTSVVLPSVYTVRRRAFPAAGVKVWNSLPADVTSAQGRHQVKKSGVDTHGKRMKYEPIMESGGGAPVGSRDRAPNPLLLSKNLPDLHQSQERPLAKVGWTCPPQSTPWRRPCICLVATSLQEHTENLPDLLYLFRRCCDIT